MIASGQELRLRIPEAAVRRAAAALWPRFESVTVSVPASVAKMAAIDSSFAAAHSVVDTCHWHASVSSEAPSKRILKRVLTVS